MGATASPGKTVGSLWKRVLAHASGDGEVPKVAEHRGEIAIVGSTDSAIVHSTNDTVPARIRSYCVVQQREYYSCRTAPPTPEPAERGSVDPLVPGTGTRLDAEGGTP